MKSISEKLAVLDNEKSHASFKNYNLNSIKKLLKHYGDPHKKIKTIHIAGTNGKGSVAHIMNSILVAAGYRTGLYSSPHLSRITERIKINNKEIPNSVLSTYTDDLLSLLVRNKNLHPTYFDCLTLFAFRYFCDQKTDIAIIETGLGGRLDSTNVINPEVSVITDISLDHSHILGSTIREIAREKAGIIKKNTQAVTSNRSGKILQILTQTSINKSSELHVVGKDIIIKNISREIDGQTFDLYIKLKSKKNLYDNVAIENISIRLKGKFQIANTAIAITSLLLLSNSGINITEPDIKAGLNKVYIPGRLQILSNDPLIIFDPAHNPAAIKATLSAVKELYPDKSINTLLSFMLDKDYALMFKIARRFAEKIFYYELSDERCLKITSEMPGKKKLLYDKIIPVNNYTDLKNKISQSLKTDSCIIITGTFRLYNIAKRSAKDIGKSSQF